MPVFSIDPIRLDPRCGVFRQPPRPEEFRQPGYAEAFDYDTLLYDAIYWPEQARLRLVGPPALNLMAHWEDARFTDAAGGKETFAFAVSTLDKVDEVVVEGVPPSAEAIDLTFAGYRYTIPIVRHPDAGMFRGRKALFAISKDNPLEWLVDWAEFHSAVHGIDTIVVFDNRSSIYSPNEVEAALARVAGIAEAWVVDWPVPWGPERGPNKVWDSNFSQHGAFSVARWRFLEAASLVINADIDELVLPLGGRDLREVCAASPSGLVTYRGLWTVGVRGVSPRGRAGLRHRDFVYSVADAAERYKSKWSLSPAKASGVRQWLTHRVDGLPRRGAFTNDFAFRHFREISTSWKWNRRGRHNVGDPRVFRDEDLAATFRDIGWLPEERISDAALTG